MSAMPYIPDHKTAAAGRHGNKTRRFQVPVTAPQDGASRRETTDVLTTPLRKTKISENTFTFPSGVCAVLQTRCTFMGVNLGLSP